MKKGYVTLNIPNLGLVICHDQSIYQISVAKDRTVDPKFTNRVVSKIGSSKIQNSLPFW